MPRQLPWAAPVTIETPTPALPTAPPPASPPSPTSPTTPSPAPSSSSRYKTLSSKRQSSSKRPANRSPSTSPPAPPPDEQFMRPGLDADDAFVMVEDEFLATARTFTAHLHHAEYQRLKALARTRKISKESPGTDEMSATLRKRKDAAAARFRHRKALEGIGALRARHTDSSDSISEEDMDDSDAPAFEENPRSRTPDAADPWLGTSLAPLLSPRTRRSEAHLVAPPSLIGLQGMRSGTRAAHGYGRDEWRERSEENQLQRGKNASKVVSDDGTKSEDDDLDAYLARPGRTDGPTEEEMPSRGDLALWESSSSLGSDYESPKWKAGRSGSPLGLSRGDRDRSRRNDISNIGVRTSSTVGAKRKAADVKAIPTFLV